MFPSSYSSDAILSMCHGFKMIGANARSLAAEMVKLKPFGNGAIDCPPCQAMSAISMNLRVSQPINAGKPDPTQRDETSVLFTVDLGINDPPAKSRPASGVVIVDESERLPFDKASRGIIFAHEWRRFPTAALAELRRRLKTHVGLLHRLTLGGAAGRGRTPNPIGISG